jgi:hypothetical protein
MWFPPIRECHGLDVVTSCLLASRLLQVLLSPRGLGADLVWFPSTTSSCVALRRRPVDGAASAMLCPSATTMVCHTRCARVLSEAIQVCNRLCDALRFLQRHSTIVSRSRWRAAFRLHW